MTLRFTWPARIGSVLLLIIYGTPLFWLVTTSFKQGADVFRGLASFVTFTPSLAAYQKVWNADLLHSAINSLAIAAGTTALTLVLAVPAAYALARLRGVVVSVGLAMVIILQMLPQTAAVIPLPWLQDASSPAPPAAAAHRKNARRPWSSAIASLPSDRPSARGPSGKDAAGSRIVGRCQPRGGPRGILPVNDLLAPESGNIVELLND